MTRLGERYEASNTRKLASAAVGKAVADTGPAIHAERHASRKSTATPVVIHRTDLSSVMRSQLNTRRELPSAGPIVHAAGACAAHRRPDLIPSAATDCRRLPGLWPQTSNVVGAKLDHLTQKVTPQAPSPCAASLGRPASSERCCRSISTPG
jgi:hypothetical protein